MAISGEETSGIKQDFNSEGKWDGIYKQMSDLNGKLREQLSEEERKFYQGQLEDLRRITNPHWGR